MAINAGSRVRHIAQHGNIKTAAEICDGVDYGTGTVETADDGTYAVRWDDAPADYTGDLCSYSGSELLAASQRPAKV